MDITPIMQACVNNGTRTITTRQIADKFGICTSTALKYLKKQPGLEFHSNGKYSYWKITIPPNYYSSDEEQLFAEDMTDFQWASIFSMRHNCVRPTTYPDTVDDPKAQEYIDNGYTLFYPT